MPARMAACEVKHACSTNEPEGARLRTCYLWHQHVSLLTRRRVFSSGKAMRAGILILLPCSAAFSGLAGVPAPRLRRASSPLLPGRGTLDRPAGAEAQPRQPSPQQHSHSRRACGWLVGSLARDSQRSLSSVPRTGVLRTVREVVDAHARKGKQCTPVDLRSSWNTLGKHENEIEQCEKSSN